MAKPKFDQFKDAEAFLNNPVAMDTLSGATSKREVTTADYYDSFTPEQQQDDYRGFQGKIDRVKQEDERIMNNSTAGKVDPQVHPNIQPAEVQQPLPEEERAELDTTLETEVEEELVAPMEAEAEEASQLHPERQKALDDKATEAGFARREFTAEYAEKQGTEEVDKAGEVTPEEAQAQMDKLKSDIDNNNYNKEAPFIVALRKADVDNNRQQKLQEAQYAFDQGYFTMAKDIAENSTTPEEGIKDTISPVEMLMPNLAVMRMLGASKFAYQGLAATFPLEFAFSYGLEDSGFSEAHPIMGFGADMTFGVLTGTLGETIARRIGSKAPLVLNTAARNAFSSKLEEASSLIVRDTPVTTGRAVTDDGYVPITLGGDAPSATPPAVTTAVLKEAPAKTPVAAVAKAEEPIDVEAMALRHEARVVELAKAADLEVIRLQDTVTAPEIISQGINNAARLDAVASEVVRSHVEKGIITPEPNMVAPIRAAAKAGFHNHPIGRTLAEKQAYLEGQKIRKAIDLKELDSPVVARVLSETSANMVTRAEVMATSKTIPQSVAEAIEHSQAAAETMVKQVQAAQENPFNTASRISTPITDSVREKLRKLTAEEYYGAVPKNFDSKATLAFLTKNAAKHLGGKGDLASIQAYEKAAAARFTANRRAGHHGEDFLNDLKTRYEAEIKVLTEDATKNNKIITADDRADIWLNIETQLGKEYKELVDEAIELRVQQGAELVPGTRSFYLKGEVESTDARFAYGTPGSLLDTRVGSGPTQAARQKAIAKESTRIRKEVYGEEIKLTPAQKAAKAAELEGDTDKITKWIAEQEQSGILGAKARAATKLLFDQKVAEAEANGQIPDLAAIGREARDEVKKMFAARFKSQLDEAIAIHNVDPNNRRYRTKDFDPGGVDNIVSDEGAFNFLIDAKRPAGNAPKAAAEGPKTYPESLGFSYESFNTIPQVRSALGAAFDALAAAKRSKIGGKGKLPIANELKGNITVYSKAKGKKITMKGLSEDDIDQVAKLYGWGPHKLSTHTGIGDDGTVYSTFADEINFGRDQYTKKLIEDPEYYEKQWLLDPAERDQYMTAQHNANKAYRAQRVKFLRKAMKLPVDSTDSTVYDALDPAYVLSKQIGQDIQALQGFADQTKAKRALVALSDMLAGTDNLAELNKMVAAAARQKSMRAYYGDTRTPREWAIEDLSIKEIHAYQQHGTNVEIMDSRIRHLAQDEGITLPEAEARYRESVMGDRAEDLDHVSPAQAETEIQRIADEEGISFEDARQKYADDEIYYKDDGDTDNLQVNEDGEVEDMVGAMNISDELGTGAQITSLTPTGKRVPKPPAESRSHVDFVEEVEIRMGTRFDDPSYSPSAYMGNGTYNLLKMNSVDDVHRTYKAFDVVTHFDDGTRSGILKNELETETPAMIKARFGVTPSKVHDQQTLNVMSAMLEDQEKQLLGYAKQMADRPGDKVMAMTLEKMRSVHRTTLSALEHGKTSEDAWHSFKGMDLTARSDRELAERIQDLVAAQPERLQEAEVFGQMLNDVVRRDKTKVPEFLARHSALDDKLGRSKHFNDMYVKKAQLEKTLREAC